MAKGAIVYVGNIDFDIPEQKIIQEMGKVGRVVSFRLMYDKQTGKSKGYGFCEYETPIIAEASTKLKITFNNRPVKINYANEEANKKSEEELPIDDLIDVLQNMDKNNLKNVVHYMKQMAVDQPKKLKKLLEDNETLAIAIFQALIELNFVEKESVYELLKNNFKIEDNKMQALERICAMSEGEIESLDASVQEKIKQIRSKLMKDTNKKASLYIVCYFLDILTKMIIFYNL